MKGLLLKDLYMVKAYCKAYLLIAVVFFVVSLSDNGNFFFAFYPCLLCGMIPVNLQGYDERSRFLQYSATLPYTKAQIVSAKYLVGLLTQVVVLVLIGVAQGVKMAVSGTFVFAEFAPMLLTALAISTLTPAIIMPFIFKYGVEKGRIAYYVMIGLVCAVGVPFSGVFKDASGGISSSVLFAAVAVAAIGIYALSWALSIRLYEKRELS